MCARALRFSCGLGELRSFVRRRGTLAQGVGEAVKWELFEVV